MATLQGKAVKNTYRQVLQIGANNVGVSGTLQAVQDGAGVNTALSLSTIAATVNGDLTVTGDLIITGGGLQIKELIDDTVADLIKNGTGITWTYNDGANTLTGNFTGTTSVVAEGSNLYYTQGRFDSAFAAKTTTNLTEGANLYFTTARGDANFASNFATKTTTNLPEGTNLYFTNARARTALSVTGGTGISYDNTTGVFNLAAIPNASLTNSSITINGQATALGSSVTLTTTNIAEGTNLYFTNVRARTALSVTASTGLDYNSTTGVFGLSAIPNASLTNSSVTINSQVVSLGSSITLTTTNIAEGTNLYWTDARFDTRFSTKTTTNLTEGTNLYYTQARFNTAFAAKSTTDLAEGTNLYYTDARARLAISETAVGLDYSNTSGVLSLTAGYAIPTTVKLGEYDTAYNRSIVSAAVTGTTTKTLTLTEQDANTITATWTDLGITTINGTANQIAATTAGNTTTIGFTNDVTMPNNLIVSGNLTINGTATYVNTQAISAKDPLFEVANDNNTTDAVDIGYYGRYYDTPQTRVEFTGLFRDASDAGKFKFFTGLVDEPTNVVNTTGTGYTIGTLVANFEGNLAGTANAANVLSTARSISATGDAAWTVNFDGSANATAALTLANTGVTASTYGTTTAVPTIAIDGKGRITSASNTNIAFPVTSVNGASGTVVLTTTNIAEGTNQYFTSARAQAAITLSTTGTSGAATYTSGNINVPIYIGGSGSINEIAAFDTTGTISSLSTATYPSLTELSYVKGVTSAIQTQLNSKLNLTGGTLTGGLIGTTGSFSSGGSGNTFTIAHTSGSGIALNITKDGNGEGLYINKASGSGNAATIVGTLNATTLVKSGGTASQFLMADGSVNTSVLTSGAYLPLAGGTLTGALNGTSATFSGNLTVDTNTFYVDSTNNRVGIGTLSPSYTLDVSGTGRFTGTLNATTTFTLDGTKKVILRSAQPDVSGLLSGSALAAEGNFSIYSDSGVAAEVLGMYYWNGSTYRSALQVANVSSGSSNLILMKDGGNVGIGTATPGTVGGATTIDGILNVYNSGSGKIYARGGGSGEIGFEDAGASSGNKILRLIYDNGILSFQKINDSFSSITSTPLTIAVGGDVLIGTTTTSLANAGTQLVPNGETYHSIINSLNTLHVYDRTNSVYRFFVSGSGTVNASNPVISVISDERLKENIKDLENGLDLIMALQPRKYDWKKESGNSGKNVRGFIAQEFEKVFPDLIDKSINPPPEGEEPYKQIRQDLMPILVKAIQEQQAQIEELKDMIAAK
jgi:hypothetical protein